MPTDVWTLTNGPSVDRVKLIIWSNTEAGVGLICACLPTLRPIFPSSYLANIQSRLSGSRRRTYGSSNTASRSKHAEQSPSADLILNDLSKTSHITQVHPYSPIEERQQQHFEGTWSMMETKAYAGHDAPAYPTGYRTPGEATGTLPGGIP